MINNAKVIDNKLDAYRQRLLPKSLNDTNQIKSWEVKYE